ncbi:MAG: glutamate formimidoyltransferase [Lachnospiraceae bacterium]|nr:glutamate formimidoyltransferase [Lachnospiraceae bacterium]
MQKLVECIPNFSEGRDKEKLKKLEECCKSVPGCSLFDFQSDESHNRCVVTLVGSPEAVEECMFKLVKLASEIIDMNKHQGAHPRMGATDVIPFVPTLGVTVEECIEMSKRLAKRIWDELKIPSFLYEDSCTREHCRNLADIRNDVQYEKMNEKLQLEEWAPDFGERKMHPTAGIIAIGARFPLVAYNVNLDTKDVQIAKNIAKTIRGKNGGYKYCKSLGVANEQGFAQVTMNLVNYEKTAVYRVQEAIKMEANRYGVHVTDTELVGLCPAKALLDAAEYYLQLKNFEAYKQCMEYHLIGE